jgi:GNAT superfamily N-acetyltransferase
MLHVREATASDLPAICALGAEVNALHHEAWPQLFAPEGPPERDSEHWQQSIARDSATTFVAVVEGVVVGFATVALLRETNSLLQPLSYGRIGSVSVAKAHRGNGIGPALMAQAEKWALSRGALDLRLNVWSFNQHALQVYKELGYVPRSVNLGKLPPFSGV